MVAAAELVGVLAHGDLAAPPGAPPRAAESLADRPVAEVMSGEPVTVGPDEPVEVAARLLVEHRIGCLPVVGDDRVVGILTESDLFTVLLRLLGGGEPSSRITWSCRMCPAPWAGHDRGRRPRVNLLTVVTEPGPEPRHQRAGRAAGRHHQRRPGGGRPGGRRLPGHRPGPARPVSGACGLAADDRLAAYDFGPDHPFQAGRLGAGLSLLRAARVLDDGDLLAFGPAADADLELIHDRDYLEALARFATPGAGAADPAEAARFGLVGDNRPFPGMDEAGRLVAGATIAAVDTVAGGDLARVRPRGRPAPRPAAPGVGFCLVNDVAVAIALHRAWPLRVLYVDLDAHHGDGVQAAFYDDPQIVHGQPARDRPLPVPGVGRGPRAGPAAGGGPERGRAPGPRTGDDGFLAAFDAVVEPLAAAFRPDLLVTQNGCDGHADDRSSDLTLSLRGFRELARRLHRLATATARAAGWPPGAAATTWPRCCAGLGAALVEPERPPAAGPGPVRLAGHAPGSGELAGPRPRRRGRAQAERRELEARNSRTVRTVRRLVLPPSVRVVYPLANRAGARPGCRAGSPRAGRHEAPRGRWCCATAAGSLLRRLEVDPGIHAFVRAPEQEREVLARIAEEPTGEVVVAHTPEGWWSATWPCSSPSPGPASPACPGCWRWARSRWPPAGGGAGWPAPARFAVEPDPFEDLHPDRLRPVLALGPGAERPLGRCLPPGPATGVRRPQEFESSPPTSPRSPTTRPTCSWPASAARSLPPARPPSPVA